METKITKKYGFDNMSIAAKFPSGASYRFSVSRIGERLTVAFSNNNKILQAQTKIFAAWMKLRPSEVNQGRFDRLEELTKTCTSGKELIIKMQNNG